MSKEQMIPFETFKKVTPKELMIPIDIKKKLYLNN
jgi:hypothetical protein